MKALIVSDTHGTVAPLINMLKNKNDFDLLLFLGDYVHDGERIGKSLDLPTYIVSGNSDFGSKYPSERVIDFMGKRILLTHGHKQRVKFGIQNLYYFSLENQADITLFGHSHIPYYERIEELIIINPGSPFHPRGNQSLGSYGILKIDKDIEYNTVYME